MMQKYNFSGSTGRGRLLSTVLVLAMFMGMLWPMTAQGFRIDIGGLVRDVATTAGVAAIVRGISGELNSFINGLLANNRVETQDMTRVVPIVSFDRKVAVGAAQVSGPAESVEKVRAVVMLQGDFQGRYRARVYVPADSSNPLRFNRVAGVGTSAVIDISL